MTELFINYERSTYDECKKYYQEKTKKKNKLINVLIILKNIEY